MGFDITKKGWLRDLVAEEVGRYDPAAAWARLPAELRGEDPDSPGLEARARMLVLRSLRHRRLVDAERDESEAFRSPLQGHVHLLLDLALLWGEPFEPSRRLAEIAAFFSAAAGDDEAARAALGGEEPAVRKAFLRAQEAVRKRYYPPGDPERGIPLFAATAAVERRLLARIALSFRRRGEVDRTALGGYLSYAAQELAFAVESQIGLAEADGPLGAARRRVARRQVARLGLPRGAERGLVRRIPAPRAPEEIAVAAPARMRTHLLEQLLHALVSGPGTPAREAWVSRFAAAAGVPPAELAAMRAEAVAFHGDHVQWFRAFGLAEPGAGGLADEWEEAGLEMMARAARILSDNLDAIVTEIRETGELTQLLAKAAAGRALTPEEKRKVRAQLIDLAKVVPALAIFAAPGGMLLLPLLAKLLPFKLLPSAFHAGDRPPPPREGRGNGGAPAG